MSPPPEQATHAAEAPPNPPASRPKPYTVFSSRERRLIVALLGTTTLVSPLTATIYLPLLPLLATHFRTSAQAINLTITVYIVCQALSPLFLASVSDHFGRRPIYLATFTLYSVASLGLALNQSSYAALLVLRGLQSLGASAVLSLNYGTVADVCVPAKRGKMLGPVLAAGNLGTCIGPIVGGWIALESGGFRWAFWALVIFGGLQSGNHLAVRGHLSFIDFYTPGIMAYAVLLICFNSNATVFAGPVINWVPNSKWWVTAGFDFQLTDTADEPDYQCIVIVGYFF